MMRTDDRARAAIRGGFVLLSAAMLLGCDAMLNSAVGAAFPGAAAHVNAQEQAAWKRVMARYHEDDGYDDVGGTDRFFEEMRKNPRKMKFCFRFFQGGTSFDRKLFDDARSKHPELFDLNGYTFSTSQSDFLFLPSGDEATLRAAAGRAPASVLCVWASGDVRAAASGDYRVYPLDKWDGVTAEDDSDADTEVTAQEKARTQASPSATSDKPKDNPELPPEDDKDKSDE